MSTIRELAHSLGLSITTVSRALDDYTDVSALTRARVRAAAEDAGTPKPLKRGAHLKRARDIPPPAAEA